MLLLAAATETGLLTRLEQALPPPPEPPRLPLAASPAAHRRLLLTLLFLGAVGLSRTWDLRGYTADGLALLSGRTRAYGYRYTEAFLSQIAHTDGAERFTDVLACWATQLWHSTGELEEAEKAKQPRALTCYVDGHRKPVYSDVLLPRGLIGRLGVILGCRALLLLHDEDGHPLCVTTHRGDQHLTVGVPAFLERYEQQAGSSRVARMIVDREGMATEFLASLHEQGRRVVTILQTNQYQGLSSFSEVGTFVPLSTDAHGKVIREVAPARIALARKDHPDAPLCLQVALIRDLRRTVPVQPDPEEAEIPARWDSDLPSDERTWWREGWQATATPAKGTTAKLIPIVTTEKTSGHRCHRTCPDVHPSLARSGKCHQRLSSPARIGHQPWIRKARRGKFGGSQTTNTPGAAARQTQAMGTERRQTRGPGQPTTGATAKSLHESQQGSYPRNCGSTSLPWKSKT